MSIRVALIGMGNCASALVQGIYKYAETEVYTEIPGIMHPVIAGYGIGDIDIVAAFDIDKNKVGKDVSEAILAPPNNTVNFHKVPRLGVMVQRGMTMDSIGKYVEPLVKKSRHRPVDVAQVLIDEKVDVVVNYLPVGSENAVKWYVEQVLTAKCAFVNCMPVFIGSDESGYWPDRFFNAGVPVLGDDIKSQVGATIVHRVLTRLFEDRGVRIDNAYQLNFGGNTDFLNMLDRERLVSKKISKTEAVTSQMQAVPSDDDIHVGPSDHIPWLHDRKWCYIRMEGTSFGDIPINLELKLEVWDSPNSAGVVIDAIRCAKLGLDRGCKGAQFPASAYFFKHPPEQRTDDQARDELEHWIRDEA